MSRFTPDAKGYVVALAGTLPTGIDQHSYWYGPDRSWGTTSGPLDYSVELFSTKTFARERARRYYPAGRVKVLSIAASVALSLEELRASHARVLEDTDKPADWRERVIAAQVDRIAELEEWAEVASAR